MGGKYILLYICTNFIYGFESFEILMINNIINLIVDSYGGGVHHTLEKGCFEKLL